MKSIFLNKFNFDSSRSEFRSIYVDIVKGVAIISVVLLHLKLADKVFPYILYIFIVRTRMSAR